MHKKIYLCYESSGLPGVLNNGAWATNITPTSATLSGKVLYASAPDTQVTVHWGAADGGDDPANWEFAKSVGAQTPGEPFDFDVDGLKPWTRYYFRCRMSNRDGTAWASTSIPFVTRGVLPEAWKTAFVGYEQRPGGGAHLEDAVMTVRGSGRDIGEPSQRSTISSMPTHRPMATC